LLNVKSTVYLKGIVMVTSAKAAVISAVPTPFDADGALDLVSARRLFASVATADVEALMVAGTTGEFPALTAQERLELFLIAFDVAGPDRVMAHVGASSAYEAVALTRAARSAGATRLAAITPYYLPASKAAVLDYYRQIQDAAGGAQVYAYLFPGLTGTVVTPQEIADVVAEVGLAGVKLSIPGTGFVAELAALVPAGVEIFSGNDALLVDVTRAGGHGVISGVSPSAPQPFLDLAAALHSGSDTIAEQAAVDALVNALGSRISLGKTALADLGLIRTDTCRMAIDPATDDERKAGATAIEAAHR